MKFYCQSGLLALDNKSFQSLLSASENTFIAIQLTPERLQQCNNSRRVTIIFHRRKERKTYSYTREENCVFRADPYGDVLIPEAVIRCVVLGACFPFFSRKGNGILRVFSRCFISFYPLSLSLDVFPLKALSARIDSGEIIFKSIDRLNSDDCFIILRFSRHLWIVNYSVRLSVNRICTFYR